MSFIFNQSIVNQSLYAISELQEKYQQLINDGVDVINCTIGDPKDDTPPDIQKQLIESLTSRSFSQYPAYIGQMDLRQSICNWVQRNYGVQLTADHYVLACNGTKEALFSFPLLFDWSNGQTILIPSLSYPIYKMSASYLGAQSIDLPLKESTQFLPDLDVIPKDALNKCQLFWINSPHNPTTAIASKSYLERLLVLAEKYQFIVCSDECYNDFYLDQKPASILEIDSQQWVCFRSLSKRSHMTGYRSGAIISRNKSIMDHLKKLRSPMGIGTPSFIQSAAIWAWDNDEHVNRHRQIYNNKRRKVKAALEHAGLNVFGGDAGFYMWLSSPNNSTSESLSDWFLNKGVLVTPGTVFGDDGNPYVRLVFCLKDDVINKLCELL